MGRSKRPKRHSASGAKGQAASAGLATSADQQTPTTARLAWTEIKASAALFGLLVMIFGVTFVASGPFYFTETQTAARWLERLQQLPSASDQPAGTPAIVEGRVAAAPPPIMRHFVAYVYETHRGGKGSASWWTEEAASKSAFAIETPAGRVMLDSDRYHYSPYVEPWLTKESIFTDPVVRDWDHVNRRDGVEPGGETDSARYRGLATGESVLAIGRTGKGNTFEADYVLAGTRAQFADHLTRTAAGRHNPTGYWFTVVGLIGLVAALAGWIAYIVRSVRVTLTPRRAAETT